MIRIDDIDSRTIENIYKHTFYEHAIDAQNTIRSGCINDGCDSFELFQTVIRTFVLIN